MIHDYDEISASHYSAYRPPLHGTILKKCLPKKRSFSNGLDIGCGTGSSTVALTKYCKKVIGIDSSRFMIEKAEVHEKIEYLYSDDQIWKFKPDHFDMVTFAGSLHYAKSQQLLNEVVRVSVQGALLVVYDFELFLTELLKELGFVNQKKHNYDHRANFSGLNEVSISLVSNTNETMKIEVMATEMAHFILSVKERYLFFKKNLGEASLVKKLVEQLVQLNGSNNFNVSAGIYYSVYEVLK